MCGLICFRFFWLLCLFQAPGVNLIMALSQKFKLGIMWCIQYLLCIPVHIVNLYATINWIIAIKVFNVLIDLNPVE